MAELVKKLHFKQAEGEQTAKAYSTTAEAGAEYIKNKIEGIDCYVAVGGTDDSRATNGRVNKSGTKAVLSTGKPPYNKLTYTTPGTYTVTFPAGVTTARLTIAGAGGGGGGGLRYRVLNGYKNRTGGKGGQGALIIQSINIIQGQTEVLIVGKGGSGGRGITANNGDIAGAGASGESSSALQISAQGGGGGAGAYYIASNVGDGANGQSYGEGGDGGSGGNGEANGSAGSPGWVIIEYGGDI